MPDLKVFSVLSIVLKTDRPFQRQTLPLPTPIISRIRGSLKGGEEPRNVSEYLLDTAVVTSTLGFDECFPSSSSCRLEGLGVDRQYSLSE